MIDPRRLCQVEIPVSDLARAAAFYAAAFGWRRSPAELHDFVVLEVPEGCPFGLSLTKQSSDPLPYHDDGRRGPQARRAGASGPIIYFAVDDPEAVVSAVLAAGGGKRAGPLRGAGYGTLFLVEDPDGNCFGLYR